MCSNTLLPASDTVLGCYGNESIELTCITIRTIRTSFRVLSGPTSDYSLCFLVLQDTSSSWNHGPSLSIQLLYRDGLYPLPGMSILCPLGHKCPSIAINFIQQIFETYLNDHKIGFGKKNVFQLGNS